MKYEFFNEFDEFFNFDESFNYTFGFEAVADLINQHRMIS